MSTVVFLIRLEKFFLVFSIFDYGKSGPSHFYLMLENLKAITQLVPVLEFEANKCEIGEMRGEIESNREIGIPKTMMMMTIREKVRVE